MLERFRTTEYSNNSTTEKYYDDGKDVITIGATFINTFRLDFSYFRYVATDAKGEDPDDIKVDMSKAKIIYRQGLKVIVEKFPNEFTVDEYVDSCYVTVKLSPEETSRFSNNYLDVSVQVAIINKKGNLMYDIPSKLSVVSPLDANEDISVHSLER